MTPLRLNAVFANATASGCDALSPKAPSASTFTVPPTSETGPANAWAARTFTVPAFAISRSAVPDSAAERFSVSPAPTVHVCGAERKSGQPMS